MSNEQVKHDQRPDEAEEQRTVATEGPDTTASTTGEAEQNPTHLEGELEILRTEHQALHDKHIRLYAEFDNFRKRTAKEKLDMIQFAGERTLLAVVPVLDDMGRAIASNEKSQDIQAVKEGFKLIHQKLNNVLLAQGLKRMEVQKGDAFDTDKHEAITKAPVEDAAMKGAVIDVVEDGYSLHDKVIRYAKVVVGE